MFIDCINSVNNRRITSSDIDVKNVNNGKEVFEKFLNAAVNLYNQTSVYELEAEKLQLDYITGKTDDILAVTLAEQKASTAVNFTVQVNNKILESYRQIMSIQL